MREFWNEIGYEPCTTFWEDFSIADKFFMVEPEAIEDTFKRALSYAELDYKYFTELVMILNHKIWQWYRSCDELGRLYDKLWRKAEELFFNKYEDNEEAVSYYYETTN